MSEELVRGSVDVEDIKKRMMREETRDVLSQLPDIASTLMNEDVSWDEEGEVDHHESVVSDINQNEIPEGLLLPGEAVRLFVEWEMLKGCSVFDPPVVQAVTRFLREPQVAALFEGLFWMVNVLKFHAENSKLLRKIRKRISQSYTATLSLAPSPKEDILGLLHFVFGYMVHTMHHKLFAKHKEAFDIRFVLDCYHIVVYELTGLLVSDVYIYNQIDRIFGDRFFMYKQDGILELTTVDMYEGSTFMEKTRVDKKDIERLRMNEDFREQARREMAEFGAQLTDRFAQASRMLHANNKTNLLLAKYEGELAKKVLDLTKKENFQDILINRARKISEAHQRSEEGAGFDGSLLKGESVENLDRAEAGSRQLLRRKGNNASLPVLKIKQKFDCGQVSPPLQMAAKNVTATTKKKTIGFTSFNIPEFSVDRLSELFEKNSKLTQQKRLAAIAKEKKLSKPTGPFDERNFQKYGGGAEQLGVPGIPAHLRKKFAEFFIIKNVPTADQVIEEKGAGVQLRPEEQKQIEAYVQVPYQSIVDYDSLERQNQKFSEEDAKRRAEEQQYLSRSLYLASLDALRDKALNMALPDYLLALGGGPAAEEQKDPKQAPLPEIKAGRQAPQQPAKRRDYLKEGSKKRTAAEETGNVYEVDYTGKMNYYDNQK